jgi:hypothetical protein
MFLLLPLLAACGGDKADTATADPGYGPNPIVPAEYELLWDLDAASCEEPGAIVYFRFQGTVGDDGRLRGEETWYWFHSGEGWDDDCADVFTIDAPSDSIWGRNNPCAGCDREFHGDFVLDESRRTCSYGYETLLDDDQRDRIEDEAYTIDVQLDTLTPSGNVNAQMLAFSYVQDDQTPTSYNGRAQARGAYVPATDGDYEGAATVDWVVTSGLCVRMGGGGG